jgi:hypothetical protein
MLNKIYFLFVLLLVYGSGISQTDTIKIKKTFFGTVYSVGDKSKSFGKISKLIKETPEADYYREKAFKQNVPILPINLVGGALLYLGVKQISNGYNSGWAYLGGSVAFITSGILLKNASNRNLKEAILIHNKQVKANNHTGQELKIGISTSKVSLVFNF